MKRFPLLVVLLLAAALLLAGCGIVLDGGNLKIQDNGNDVVSIGSGGLKLNGSITGLTLDSNGLSIRYPDGTLMWDSAGFNVNTVGGNLRIADSSLVITDRDGKQKTVDTGGDGIEYKTTDGQVVRTGKKASLPADYPADAVPLMDEYSLEATAELGSVEVVTVSVPGKSIEDAIAFYQPLLSKGEKYSLDRKTDSAVLRAKLGEREVAIYLLHELTADGIHVSVVVSKK